MNLKIKNVKLKIILQIVMCYIVAGAVYYIFDAIIEYFNNDILKSILNLIGWPIIFVFIIMSIFKIAKLFEYIMDNSYPKREEITDKLKETLLDKNNSKQDKDIINLMIENMVEIREYFNISKKQAKQSFVYAVGTTIFGLIMFIISMVVAIAYKELNASIITAIGGSITEIISIIALKVNRDAQKQLNYYYSSLHENEKYLSTISLVSKVSKDLQDELYAEIIRNYLEKNILDLKTEKYSNKGMEENKG